MSERTADLVIKILAFIILPIAMIFLGTSFVLYIIKVLSSPLTLASITKLILSLGIVAFNVFMYVLFLKEVKEELGASCK